MQHAVNCCCRLPFLRHTPLKELYRLAKYLSETRYKKGDVLIQQVRRFCKECAGTLPCH